MQFSKEEKEMWLEDWKRSGKKAWTYAKENGLVPQTFVSWTTREKKSSFVEIPVQIIPPQASRHEMRIEKGEVKINIPTTTCINDLKTIFRVLGAIQ